MPLVPGRYADRRIDGGEAAVRSGLPSVSAFHQTTTRGILHNGVRYADALLPEPPQLLQAAESVRGYGAAR